MVRALSHRGPDSDGIHRGPLGAIGARRLAIVDLDQGHQPISNEDGRLTIVFNGEIYNYLELREHLLQRGHRFTTRSDTEVILHLYEEYGPRCVERLRGMFAFAILSDDHVYLARDRFGIKPLFIHHDKIGDNFFFASEIKALLQWPALDVTINAMALADYYVLGYAAGEQTPFREVESLPPGHYLIVSRASSGLAVCSSRYFTLQIEGDSEISTDKAVEDVLAVLTESVALHVHAETPVGVTLSGGLDSSLLAFLANRQKPGQVPSYTVACSHDNVDLQVSRSVAQHLTSPHFACVLSFDQYLTAIPAYIRSGETWSGLYGLPFFLLCKAMSSSIRVCLNGEGADELFGGYWRYLHPESVLADLKRKLLAAQRHRLTLSPRANNIAETLLRSSHSWRTFVEQLLSIYQEEQLESNHLRLLDHYAMSFGIELRVPFLDDRLARLVNALPLGLKVNRMLGSGKYILRRAALRYGTDAFGDEPILRTKVGMPSAGENYLRRFEAMCAAAIPDSYALKHEFKHIFCTKDKHGRIRGKDALLLFDMFCDTFISRRGASDTEPVKTVLDSDALSGAGPQAFDVSRLEPRANQVHTV